MDLERIKHLDSTCLLALESNTTPVLGEVTLSNGTDSDYHTFEEALKHVSDGGTLRVKPGSYKICGINLESSDQSRDTEWYRSNTSISLLALTR